MINQIYCPKCEEVYIPRTKHLDIDGAYFGCSFAHIFLQLHPEIVGGEHKEYVPRIFGFRVVGKRGSKYREIRYSRERETKGEIVQMGIFMNILAEF
jgi:hypothetical protein